MQASRILPVVILMTIIFSVNAPISFAVASQDGASVCAREVPSGSTVDPSAGTVALSNGSVVVTTAFPCSMTSVIWSTTGNAAYGKLTLSNSYYYTSYSDEWTSPPAPSSGSFSSPEGVGLYDGLQTSSDIVQPLLVYGCIISTDCSNSWRLTAYAYVSSTIYYVTPVSPSQGDTIEGEITYDASLSMCSSNGPGYTTDADIVSGSSSSLTVCTTDQYKVADAGSIEVHSLSTCTQMPGTGSDDFDSISFATAPSQISATESTGSDVSFCSASATWNTSTLDISWTYT